LGELREVKTEEEEEEEEEELAGHMSLRSSDAAELDSEEF